MIDDIKDITSFKWATVRANNPLSIQLDGDTSPMALIPDSLIDPLSLAVGDRVRVELSLRKVVVHGESNGGVTAGEVKITAAATAPAGWLLCRGQSLLRSDYPRLFTTIGTVYGAADSTHFTVPDLRGRVVVGWDPSQSEFDVLGEAGGEKAHKLTVAEMPSHSHMTGIITNQAMAGTAGGFSALVSFTQNQSNTSSTGGDGVHNNLQPYIALNYIIKI